MTTARKAYKLLARSARLKQKGDFESLFTAEVHRIHALVLSLEARLPGREVMRMVDSLRTRFPDKH